MPLNFIRADGYGITLKCRRYLEPLIHGEAYPPYGPDGLPRYVALRNRLVRRKLPPYAIEDG
jgi:6-phosphofructokinase 1